MDDPCMLSLSFHKKAEKRPSSERRIDMKKLCMILLAALLLLMVGFMLYLLFRPRTLLLFRLADGLAAKTKLPFLTPLVSCTIVTVLGWINFRGIGKLIAFASPSLAALSIFGPPG